MHVNALRRQTAFPSNWIRFKIQNQCFTWNTTSSTTTRERALKNHHQQLNHPTMRFTWNTLTSLGHRKAKTTFHVKQMGCCKNVVFHVKHQEAFKHQKTQPSPHTIKPRKHKTKWQNPANPTFIYTNTPHPPHKTSFKTQPQAQKISFTSITHVPRETQQLNKLQQPTTFHVKHQPSANMTSPLIQPLGKYDSTSQNHSN